MRRRHFFGFLAGSFPALLSSTPTIDVKIREGPNFENTKIRIVSVNGVDAWGLSHGEPLPPLQSLVDNARRWGMKD